MPIWLCLNVCGHREEKKIPKFYLEARAWKFALTPKKLEFPTKYNADWWFSQRQNLGL